MGFALEQQTEKQQEKAVEGRRQKVAVSCWFTAKGKSIPLFLKYEDADGGIQCIRDIRLLKSEEKHFAGIRMRRYDCCTEDKGIMKYFTLLFHVEDGTWEMVAGE